MLLLSAHTLLTQLFLHSSNSSLSRIAVSLTQQGLLAAFLERFDRRLAYVGRPPQASPAVGSLKQHGKEQAKILNSAVGPAPDGAAADAKDTKADGAKAAPATDTGNGARGTKKPAAAH